MTTVHEMVLRRQFVAAGRARRRPRRLVPVVPPPNGAVIAYTRELLALARAIDDATLDVLRRERLIRADDDSPLTPLPSQAARVIREIEDRMRHVVSRASLVGAIDRIAARVGTYSADAWRRELKATLGVDLAHDVNLAPLLAQFRTRNLALITSLTSDHVARVARVLHESAGGRVEDLAAQIEATTGATAARAALIARDQTLKLNGQLTRARHEAAGITTYTWSTSHDERVRPGHAELDARSFAYASPPIVDPKSGRRCNPGEDYQCRCIAVPVIPGVDDARAEDTA